MKNKVKLEKFDENYFTKDFDTKKYLLSLIDKCHKGKQDIDIYELCKIRQLILKNKFKIWDSITRLEKKDLM